MINVKEILDSRDHPGASSSDPEEQNLLDEVAEEWESARGKT